MIFFQINGKNITSPKEISHSSDILDKIERTMDGTMVVDIIGKKERIDVSWDYLSKDQMMILNNEVKASNFITISYRSIEDGSLITLLTVFKDLTYSPGYDWVGNKVIWKNVSISFEEV